MTDRELLEAAAKAAGIALQWDDEGKAWIKWPSFAWSPLTDDGDALRLAVKLDLHVMRFDSMTTVRPNLKRWTCDERDAGDPCAATRRAIVRAAAAIAQEKTP